MRAILTNLMALLGASFNFKMRSSYLEQAQIY